jgi:hypothetical protein
MAFVRHAGQTHALQHRDTAVIVEASDIPILSSTDRLQRALLRWVDLCGLSGHFVSESDVIHSLKSHEFLDEHSYLLEVEGHDLNRWSIMWTGAGVTFGPGQGFREAVLACVPDDRFANLIAEEYLDAVRYRRASARRFAHRNTLQTDTMDQLIFPLRNAERTEFVLVIGEAVTGRTLYAAAHGAAGTGASR